MSSHDRWNIIPLAYNFSCCNADGVFSNDNRIEGRNLTVSNCTKGQCTREREKLVPQILSFHSYLIVALSCSDLINLVFRDSGYARLNCLSGAVSVDSE